MRSASCFLAKEVNKEDLLKGCMRVVLTLCRQILAKSQRR